MNTNVEKYDLDNHHKHGTNCTESSCQGTKEASCTDACHKDGWQDSHSTHTGSAPSVKKMNKGSTDYEYWDQVDKLLPPEEEKKSKDPLETPPEAQIWGCAQDHRKVVRNTHTRRETSMKDPTEKNLTLQQNTKPKGMLLSETRDIKKLTTCIRR